MNIPCIIPAAGFGRRMYSLVPKQFIKVGEKYILEHTIKKISKFSSITEIILVVNKEIKSEAINLVEKNRFKKVNNIVIGGRSRAESVLNGLEKIPLKYDWIVVHDGVRPLVSQQILTNCIKEIKKDSSIDGVVPGLPIESTVKKINSSDNTIEKTINRDKLRKIQTPQIIRKEKLIEAYKKVPKEELSKFTDDSHILEEVEGKIKVVKGRKDNLKVTTSIDLGLVKFFLDRTETEIN